MATTKDQVVLEVWEKAAKDVVGASDLTLIQDALVERFGSESSPASIARVLADHGARLGHPEILQADSRWRESHLFGLFTPEELTFDSLEAATALVEKIERLREEFKHDDSMLERLRQSVLQMKRELELLATSQK